jgi:hypothetical protein
MISFAMSSSMIEMGAAVMGSLSTANSVSGALPMSGVAGGCDANCDCD